METLVLPAQDQFARHQDGRPRRAAGMLQSPRVRQGNMCGSSSQLGRSNSDLCGRFVAICDDHIPIDASAVPFYGTAEALASHGSVVVESRVSSSKKVRPPSVPTGHGSRKNDGFSSKVYQSEGSVLALGGDKSASSFCEFNSMKISASEIRGQVVHRYSSKCLVWENAVQAVYRSEVVSSERDGCAAAESGQIARTSSLKSFLREAPKIVGSTPPVTILQRPKTIEEASTNLAKLLSWEGSSIARQQSDSSAARQQSAGGRVCNEEVVSLKSSKAKLRKYHKQACASKGPHCGAFSRVQRNTSLTAASATCVSPTLRENGNESHGKGLQTPDLTTACTSNSLLVGMKGWRQDDCLSFPCQTSNERWAGPSCLRPTLRENGIKDHIKGLISPDPAVTSSCGTPFGMKGCQQEDSLSSSSPPLNERWAGPAYSNSPPPSSLPFPKFSKRQLRTSSLDIPLAEVELCDDVDVPGSFSAPGTPSRKHFSFSSSTVGSLGLCLDVAYATMDLRRLLNLDPDA